MSFTDLNKVHDLWLREKFHEKWTKTEMAELMRLLLECLVK